MKVLYIIPIVCFLMSCANDKKKFGSELAEHSIINEDTVSFSRPKEYRYNRTGNIYLLDKPNGEKVLNKKATDYFGKPYYYNISSADPLIVKDSTDKWVFVEQAYHSQNSGWILKDKVSLVEQVNNESIETAQRSGKYKTSKGYTSDPNYKPTVDERGSYHTIDGKRKQIQYQGSKEQQDQLDEMKKRGW